MLRGRLLGASGRQESGDPGKHAYWLRGGRAARTAPPSPRSPACSPACMGPLRRPQMANNMQVARVLTAFAVSPR